MTTTVTGVEQWVRDAVLGQLAWEPGLDATMVAVTAQDGIITLSGYVDTYAAKLAAERAARRFLVSRGSLTNSTCALRTTGSIRRSRATQWRR